jgi:hypothetical protein
MALLSWENREKVYNVLGKLLPTNIEAQLCTYRHTIIQINLGRQQPWGYDAPALLPPNKVEAWLGSASPMVYLKIDRGMGSLSIKVI